MLVNFKINLPFILDLETSFDPLLIFKNLYSEDDYAVLYESMDSLGARGRFSFIAGNPVMVLQSADNGTIVRSKEGSSFEKEETFSLLRSIVKSGPDVRGEEPFLGGALGYIGYNAAGKFDKINTSNSKIKEFPDILFLIPGDIIVVDHVRKTGKIVVYGENRRERAEKIRQRLVLLPGKKENKLNEGFQQTGLPDFKANTTRDEFCEMAKKAKEYIIAGDIFQVVISQQFEFELKTSPLTLYNALRFTNPAPYLYFLKLKDFTVLGSSPEMLVEIRNGIATTRPLAGTRPRGNNPEEDKKMKMQLMLDEKEKAEHIMLVDLARNDLGRVCVPGTVRVDSLLKVEKFSKVMHLVSNVTGQVKNDTDSFDVVKACFPAGTVSGAPKIRAMEIIDELEKADRGVYAGAIGYFGFDGNSETCIGIRMIVLKGDKGVVQAGAGIVADSVPEREYDETINKARAVLQAAALAGSKNDFSD
ncbi:anthranilate synthase component I family protein [bacterium]|nr:anthranilate synthase component I family protein [bacterium]